MALRDLSLGEMAGVTSHWLTTDRDTFRSIPEIAGLYARVEDVHAAIISAQRVATPADVDALIEQTRALDARHDDLVRAIYYVSEGAAAYLRALDPPKADQAAALLAARDAVLPDGLATAKQSYLAEAGNAERALALVEGTLEKTLKQQPAVHGASMLDVVKLWGTVAAELGTAENQKAGAQARAQADAKTDSATKQAILGVRNLWIQVVNTVLAALDVSSAPRDHVDTIRATAAAAMERTAARRAKGAKGKEGGDGGGSGGESSGSGTGGGAEGGSSGAVKKG